jgi:hypothetical protein
MPFLSSEGSQFQNLVMVLRDYDKSRIVVEIFPQDRLEMAVLGTQLPARLPIRLCDRATFPTCNNMSADRKASFKQPPRHVTDTAVSQEVRRNKVCRLQDHVYDMLYSHERRLWKSKNACETSLLHQKVLFNAYRIFRDGLSVWIANAILIYLQA